MSHGVYIDPLVDDDPTFDEISDAAHVRATRVYTGWEPDIHRRTWERGNA